MQELTISWPTGTKTFSPADSPVTLGRSLESSVVVSELTASRQHMNFVWSGEAWNAEDISTHGSFTSTGVALEKNWVVLETLKIRLGDPDGQDIEVGLSAATDSPPTPPLPPVADEHHMTAVFDEVNPASTPDQAESLVSQPSPIPSPADGIGAPTPDPALPPLSTADDVDSQFGDVLPPLPGQDSGVSSEPFSSGDSDDEAHKNTVIQEPDAAEAPSLFGDTPNPVETPQPPTFGDTPNPVETPPEPSSEASLFDPVAPADPEAPADPIAAADQVAPFDPIAPVDQEAPTNFQAPPQPPEQDSPTREQSSVESGNDNLPPQPPTQNQDPSPLVAQPFAAPSESGPAQSWNPPQDQAQQPTGPATTGPSTTGGATLPNAGGHWAEQASTTVIQDNSIRIEIDDEHHVFQPHEEVTIGRDSECAIVLDKRHALASRQHVRITFRENSWWMEDFSSKGTFVDGNQIKNPYQASGGFKAMLGNKQAGTEVKIVAPGEHKTNAQSRLPIYAAIGSVIVLLAVVVGIGLFALSDEEEVAESTTTTISEAQMEAEFLIQAKRSTVLIVSDTEEGVSTGSGFFVSENLIVTNQHVVFGDDLLEIAISSGDDDPVEFTYTGEIAELHPFLDIAVVRLTGSMVPAETEADQDLSLQVPGFATGPLQSGSDTTVEIGSSEDIVLGTTVFSTGFPGSFNSVGATDQGDLQFPPVGIDQGTASSLAIWPGCNNPTAEGFIPIGSPPTVICNEAGDVPNAVITTSLTSGPGASGSPVYQDGLVVAVVFAGAAGEVETNSGKSITTSSFSDWLDPIIAAG